MIHYQLTPQKRLVHEYTFGLFGKPVLKPGQIAKKLKMDGSKVAKLRTSIFNKMKPHLERMTTRKERIRSFKDRAQKYILGKNARRTK